MVCDGSFVPTDLKGTQGEIWNNLWSCGCNVIPPTHTGVELVRLLAPSGMHPVPHGHMRKAQCKALVTVGSREMEMCCCVHLFPEHLGILEISDLFFTSECKFLCNWKINVFFCMISTEDIINSVLRVSQTASIFKWDFTGDEYLHKKTIFLLYRHSIQTVSSMAWHFI